MNRSRTVSKLLALILTAATFSGCSHEGRSTTDDELTGSPHAQQKKKTRRFGPCNSSDELCEHLRKAARDADRISPEVRERFRASIRQIHDSGIEKSAKQVGDQAVDGELIGWDGKTFQLSQLWRERPIVLMWYRGGWCPYCNLHLYTMQDWVGKIEDAGARLVVLTPELPEKAKQTADKDGLEFVALHDRDNQLAKKYGIVFELPEEIAPMYRDKLKLSSYNGSDKLQLPLPATYVIDTSGKITYAFLDADFKKRAKPQDILAAVKKVAAKK